MVVKAWSLSTQEEENWIDTLRALSDSRGRMPQSKYDDANIRGTEIPKVIHFIWLGSNPIPKFPFLDYTSEGLEWNECMLSWKKHHAPKNGWQIHLWTDKDIIDDNTLNIADSLKLALSQMHNTEAFKYAMKIQHYAMASDILRLEILNTFGGTYIDVDYWCVDCLDNIISGGGKSSKVMRPLQFFCGESNTGCLELNNGLLSCCRGGHPIVWKMMQSVQTYCQNLSARGNNEHQMNSVKCLLTSYLDIESLNRMQYSFKVADKPTAMDVIEHTGPGLLTRTVFRYLCNGYHDKRNELHVDESRVMVFSSDVFHPLPNHLRKEYGVKLHEFIHPKVTIAVHLWGCSWQDG